MPALIKSNTVTEIFTINVSFLTVNGHFTQLCADELADWLSNLHQHSIGYLGDSFIGQKTQPTVSKYWRKERYKSKENPENNTKQTTQNTAEQ